ncbi:GNAT family N-acetyltransferase [Bacteroides bouchesdurhonensis]|uniref:GNAT family N-acetyltransferase n=1 Tax=Bacteroides bouchesdurhonensis TaxID=1841855 RepID=UPI0021CB3926|nr:GNAT family N-acetyltransferase [Bacteroides bouchesdurhonensis]
MKITITEHWNEYLSFFETEQKDIYFQEEYVCLYKTEKEVPKCVVAEDDGNYMLFPFLCRSFLFDEKAYYDFETAYGYGGPIFNTKNKVFRISVMKELYKYFSENNYVAGFVRFHPLLNNFIDCESIGSIILDRKTVAMDLSMTEEEIWKNEIHTKNRNVIKKGIKNGLEFVLDDGYKYIYDFIRLYNSTMDRLSADDFYYFDGKYYEEFIKKLPNSFLGVVKLGDKVLSAAIFMYSAPYAHYHLSGSNKEYLFLSPNNYMLYEAAKELKRRGALYFHLGGGSTSKPDDSLFNFKSRFSKSTCQFATGKMIFNKPVYDSLCFAWAKKKTEKKDKYKSFLLKYKY